MGTWLRNPRTTSELRYESGFEVDVAELDFKVSFKRRDPPNAWDDLARRDRNDRSWKRHRKRQWKMSKGHEEECISCGDPTERVGPADDSLSCEHCGEGPLCGTCHHEHLIKCLAGEVD